MRFGFKIRFELLCQEQIFFCIIIFLFYIFMLLLHKNFITFFQETTYLTFYYIFLHIFFSFYTFLCKTERISRETSTENEIVLGNNDSNCSSSSNKKQLNVASSTKTTPLISPSSRPIAIATPIKKKSSSFLHRGVKKPMLIRSQVSL